MIGPSTASAVAAIAASPSRPAATSSADGSGPGSATPATIATFIDSAGMGVSGRRSRNVRWPATTSPSTTTSMLIG